MLIYDCLQCDSNVNNISTSIKGTIVWGWKGFTNKKYLEWKQNTCIFDYASINQNKLQSENTN